MSKDIKSRTLEALDQLLQLSDSDLQSKFAEHIDSGFGELLLEAGYLYQEPGSAIAALPVLTSVTGESIFVVQSHSKNYVDAFVDSISKAKQASTVLEALSGECVMFEVEPPSENIFSKSCGASKAFVSYAIDISFSDAEIFATNTVASVQISGKASPIVILTPEDPTWPRVA